MCNMIYKRCYRWFGSYLYPPAYYSFDTMQILGILPHMCCRQLTGYNPVENSMTVDVIYGYDFSLTP